MMFNRAMLPAYYGILRLCCQQSRQFTRHLANHQNLNWAFKNITPYPNQYAAVSFDDDTLQITFDNHNRVAKINNFSFFFFNSGGGRTL